MERYSKKLKVGADKVTSNEINVLLVKKKNNSGFEDSDLIEKVMMKHFFMRALDKSSRRQVIKEFSLCLVSENVTIFKQGEIGNYFYIIKEGKVDLIINDKFIKSLSNGDSFGELALLHGASRSGTIKTSKTTTMWVLPRAKFRSVIDHINKENFEDNKKFLQSVPLLGITCLM